MIALVTGAGGFIGSHLAELLLQLGAHVRCIDALIGPSARRDQQARLDELQDRGALVIRGNLNELDLSEALSDVTHIFHLAALPGVQPSWQRHNFAHYASNNMVATTRLLEAVATSCPQLIKFVFASSSSVYGTSAKLPTAETDPTRPISPYGITKLAGEQLCQAFGKASDLPIVIARLFTVYGPRQRPDMAFSRFIDAVATGQAIHMNGDGTQTRDFTFVADTVRGLVAAGISGRPGQTYNIATGTSTSLLEVLTVLEMKLGRPANVTLSPCAKGDPVATLADTSLATHELGFSAECGIEEGLDRQIALSSSGAIVS